MSSAKTWWRSPALGTPVVVDAGGGRLRCFEAGDGPPVVFVHGVLTNANLWRKVVDRLAPVFRCVTLDLPLGSHELAMGAEADLRPPALAGLVLDAIEALGRRLLPSRDAEALAAALPTARLEWIEDSYTFSAEDQPERLAELIAAFVREPVVA